MAAAAPSNGASAPPTGAERLSFCSIVLVGYKVEVQMKSGVVYEGIYHVGMSDAKGMHIILKYARVVKDPNAKLDALAEKPKNLLVVDPSDLVQLVAKDVRMNAEDLAPGEDFETDASIGRGRGGAFGRDLQRWVPDDGEEAHEFHLEDDSTGWDQFAVNKEKFGVETTFQEEIYTTRLDRNNCAISEEQAAKLAREIELGLATNPATNYHLLEERGMEVDDHGMDEEDKYSSVIRQPPAPQPQAGMQQRPRPGAPQQGAGPGGRAWGNAGAGVAAVARGLNQPPPPPPPHPGMMMQQPPPPPRPAMPQSGDMDALRRETNKVRSQLASGAMPIKKAADMRGASPYGTPKSPINSPLVSDGATLMSLNLESVAAPSKEFSPEVLSEFELFKKKRSQQKEQEEQAKRMQDLKAAAASAKPAGEGAAAGTSAEAGSDSKAAVSKAEGGESKKGGLNPFAKPFSLNANAKAFVPTFTPSAAPAATTVPAPAPAAPVPAPMPMPVAVPAGPGLVPGAMPAQAFAPKPAGPMGPIPVMQNPAFAAHQVRPGMPGQPGMHHAGPGSDQASLHAMQLHAAAMHQAANKAGLPGMDGQHHPGNKPHMMGMPPQQPQPQMPGSEQQGPGAGGPHGGMPMPMQPMQGPYMSMPPGAQVQPMGYAPNGMPMTPMMGPGGQVIMGPGFPPGPGQMRPAGMAGPPGGPPTMIMTPIMQQVPSGYNPAYGMPGMQGGPRAPYPGFPPQGFQAVPHMGMVPSQGPGAPPMQGGPGMDGHHHGGMRGPGMGPGGPGKGMGGRGGGRGDRGPHHPYGGPQGNMPNPAMVMQVSHEGARMPDNRGMQPPPPPPPAGAGAGMQPAPMAVPMAVPVPAPAADGSGGGAPSS